MSQRTPALKFAVCIDNADYPASLEIHKIYRVLPDEDAAVDGDIRVVDESVEDYPYPAEYFILVEYPSLLKSPSCEQSDPLVVPPACNGSQRQRREML